jgi:predicted nucleic acid-binding protein
VSAPVVYLDSSALVKLVFDEPETDALRTFLGAWPVRVSSALASIEVLRVASRAADPEVEREARRALQGVSLVRMDDALVAIASSLRPPGLRSLDAIHLATAQLFGHELGGMVAYDQRLTRAARQFGITVWSPS